MVLILSEGGARRNENERRHQKKVPQRNALIALFDDTMAADRVIRGLIDDQIKIVNPENLIRKFNPELVEEMNSRGSLAKLSALNAGMLD